MRFILTLGTLCAVISVAQATPQWVYFDYSKPAGTPPSVEVLSASLAETQVRITIPGMWVSDTVFQGQTYKIIALPDCPWHTWEIGKPKLPGIWRMFCLPPTSGTDVEIVPRKQTLLNNYRIIPAGYPEPDGGPAVIPIQIPVDTTDVFYPESTVVKSSAQIWRDIRTKGITFYPFKNNSKRKLLAVCYDFTTIVHFRGTDINSLSGYPQAYFQLFEDKTYRRALGYDPIVPSPPRLGGTGILWEWSTRRNAYLILTANDYWDNDSLLLKEFAFWKTKMGVPTGIRKLSDIGGGERGEGLFPYQIREYIRDCYYHNVTFLPPIPKIDPDSISLLYVLLVGDVPRFDDDNPEYQVSSYSLIPTYPGWWNWLHPPLPPDDSSRDYSDFYYTLMEGDADSVSDITVGRLCPTSHDSIQILFDKIYQYERYPLTYTWGDKAQLVAAWQTSTYKVTKEWIRDYVLTPHNYDCQFINGSSYHNSDIENAINSPTSSISLNNYYGHGDTAINNYPKYCWCEWNQSGGDNFTTDNVRNLTNNTRLPLVFNVCCYYGRIGGFVESMVEAWTRNPNGGAAGALGASNVTSTANQIFDQTLFDILLSPYHSVGWALTVAQAMIKDYQSSPRKDGFSTAEQYYWIGDPSLYAWGDRPNEHRVTHPLLIPRDQEVDFSVTVEARVFDGEDYRYYPVPSAMVCLFKFKSAQPPGMPELHRIGATNDVGEITFYDLKCPTDGYLYVTVTKFDPDSRYLWVPTYPIKPYEGVCLVVSFGQSSSAVSTKPTIKVPWSLPQVSPNPTNAFA